MSIFEQESDIFINCPKFIPPYLGMELSDLGYHDIQPTLTGVGMKGSLSDCMRLNLYLRTAFRVLYLVKQANARDAKDLYKEIKSIPWEKYFTSKSYFSIDSYTQNSTINDTRFTALKAKDAIADRFVELFGERPNSGADKSEVCIYIHWSQNQLLIYLDTSGETIAKHAYRKIPFKAPLQESLATAIIMASGWDKKTSFINPMCGSGTLAIEAAMMAANIYPGSIRQNYAFMHLNDFNKSDYEILKNKLTQEQSKQLDFEIIASDSDPLAVQAAQKNAEAAGVEHLIKFECKDFKESDISQSKGVLIVNPEYGSRLGIISELELQYEELGDFFKQKCKGYHCFIFTGNIDLAKKVGLKASSRKEFYNSTIECRLLKYEMYDGSKKNKS
jgi:putative N6-adenine-specific DNA methylase